MHSNNNDGDMDGFVEFAKYWSGLTHWQKFRVYAHAMIQYRLIGALAIFGAALVAIVLSMAMTENIYISLVVGAVAGVSVARC